MDFVISIIDICNSCEALVVEMQPYEFFFCKTTEPLGLQLLYSSNKESDIQQCQDQKCKCKLKGDSNQSNLNTFAKNKIV